MSYEIVGTKLSAKYDYDRPKSEKKVLVFLIMVWTYHGTTTTRQKEKVACT